MNGLRIAVLQHEPTTGLGSFAYLLPEAGVAAEIVRGWQDPLPVLQGLDGVIVLGGSGRAIDASLSDLRRWIATAVSNGTPYFGICLGAQLLAASLGARVFPGPRPEIGVCEMFLTDAARRDQLFGRLPRRLRVFQWHQDTFALPHKGVALAGSFEFRHQAFRWGRYAFGLQFHPEVMASTVAAWPGAPGYLDQLQVAGIDAARLVAQLADEEPRFRDLARALLERWLALCVEAAALRSG